MITGLCGCNVFFLQICDKVNSEQWTVERQADGAMGAIAHRGNQWVGYDDVSDIRRKVQKPYGFHNSAFLQTLVSCKSFAFSQYF